MAACIHGTVVCRSVHVPQRHPQTGSRHGASFAGEHFRGSGRVHDRDSMYPGRVLRAVRLRTGAGGAVHSDAVLGTHGGYDRAGDAD